VNHQPAEQHVIIKKKGVQKHEVKRHHVRKPVKHWKRGQHVPSWQRKHVVRDYRHHGLRRPGHGQHWVKVDNSYLLVGIASGVIAGLVAAH
jgi:Ni/Co efflux regulator RcnB